MRSRERSLDLALRIVHARTPGSVPRSSAAGVGASDVSRVSTRGAPVVVLALKMLARAWLRRRRD